MVSARLAFSPLPAACPPLTPCFYRELLLVHRFLPYEMLLMGCTEPAPTSPVAGRVRSTEAVSMPPALRLLSPIPMEKAAASIQEAETFVLLSRQS